AERVAEASDLVARLVQAPAFPPEEVERLRNHQVAGILQRRAEPRGFANELAARFIFADESPFSRPLHGYSATVVGLTREDVQGFHAATYSPQGAALVVAGNLDPAAVLETAEAAFGAWSGPSVPQQVAPVTPRDQGV